MARAGVEATLGVGGGSDTVTPGAIFGYEERPTVTYVPIEGREFAQHMLSSIPRRADLRGSTGGVDG